MKIKKVGLIINPIAGMGGSVGLKGTDGMLEEAVQRGAVPMAERKTQRALEKLILLQDQLHIFTGGGELGEELSKRMNFRTQVLYQPLISPTTAEDTRALAKKLREENVDLILYAGGDGTARNLVEAEIDTVPSIGIPAGVKIQSSAFAMTPEKAGEMAAGVLQGNWTHYREAEVLDIHEEAYRSGEIRTCLFGYLTIPDDFTKMQSRKAPSPVRERESQMDIAWEVIEQMEEGTVYFIGPGTTTRSVLQALNQPWTLLGVDAVLDGKVLCLDAKESDLILLAEQYPCKAVLTPTGRQGFLIGRGNQQISSKLWKFIGLKGLVVIATAEKLAELKHRPLLVDSGDPKADVLLQGYVRVITGWKNYTMYPVGNYHMKNNM